MMTLEQAQCELDKHLAHSSKVGHSRVVAHLMRRLAEGMRRNAALWEIVGLCHDFDGTVTKDKRQLHGIITARWLENDLPREALEAIRAHDHRTGVQADTDIANALKLADALAIADEEAGREAMTRIGTDDGWQQLSQRLDHKLYLLPIISELSGRMNLSLHSLTGLFESAPRQ